MMIIQIESGSSVDYYSPVTTVFQDQQTIPRLISAKFSMNLSNLSGAMVNYTAEIFLDNTGKELSKLEDDIIGKKVVIYLNKVPVFTGNISERPGRNGIKLQLRADIFTFLNQHIDAFLSREAYEQIPIASEGNWGNFITGYPSGWFKASRVAPRFYFIAFNHLSSIDDVTDPEGNAVSYTLINTDGGNAVLYCNEECEYLKVKAKGPVYQGASNVIDNPAEMLKLILEKCIGNGVVLENTSMFDDLGYSRNAICLGQPISYRELFEKFQKSFPAHVFVTRTGEFKILVRDWGNEQAVMKLTEREMVNFKIIRSDKKLNRVTRNFDYYFSDGSYQKMSRSLQIDPNSPRNAEISQSYITEPVTSLDAACRVLAHTFSTHMDFSFSVPPHIGVQLELGMIIEIEHNELDGIVKTVVDSIKYPGTGFFNISSRILNVGKLNRFVLLDENDPAAARLLEENDGNAVALI